MGLEILAQRYGTTSLRGDQCPLQKHRNIFWVSLGRLSFLDKLEVRFSYRCDDPIYTMEPAKHDRGTLDRKAPVYKVAVIQLHPKVDITWLGYCTLAEAPQ